MCSRVDWHLIFLVLHSVHGAEPLASHFLIRWQQRRNISTLTFLSRQASQLGSFRRWRKGRLRLTDEVVEKAGKGGAEGCICPGYMGTTGRYDMLSPGSRVPGHSSVLLTLRLRRSARLCTRLPSLVFCRCYTPSSPNNINLSRRSLRKPRNSASFARHQSQAQSFPA
jgi:hypothetical protein